MAEFRYTGFNRQQKRIIGYVEAENKRAAKLKIDTIARQRGLSIRSIESKATFLYKVRKPDGTWLKGEQEAYSQDDVELALHRMGYDQVKVQKSILNLSSKPRYADVITFIRLSADMLREKLPFDEILGLLEIDMPSKPMKKVIKEILNDLKSGKDGEEVFAKQAHTLGKFPAKMLGVASKSGNMAEVYENTARFLERDYEFRKNLRSALLMPSITLVVLFAAVVFYVGYIFPKTAEMFAKFGAELPPMTRASLDLSHFITSHIVAIVLIVAIPPIIFWRFAVTERGKIFLGKYLIKMPVVGPILHKSSIEIFCRVFHSMYVGSGENIEVIKTAAEACRNKYMEKQIKEITIPLMVSQGESFVEALKKARVFTENALTRLSTGAESGTLKKVSYQIASFYERETSYRMKGILDWIQVYVAFVILIVMTLLTVVSSETAVMQPKLPGM